VKELGWNLEAVQQASRTPSKAVCHGQTAKHSDRNEIRALSIYRQMWSVRCRGRRCVVYNDWDYKSLEAECTKQSSQCGYLVSYCMRNIFPPMDILKCCCRVPIAGVNGLRYTQEVSRVQSLCHIVLTTVMIFIQAALRRGKGALPLVARESKVAPVGQHS
jgi:hypothetical protein